MRPLSVRIVANFQQKTTLLQSLNLDQKTLFFQMVDDDLRGLVLFFSDAGPTKIIDAEIYLQDTTMTSNIAKQLKMDEPQVFDLDVSKAQLTPGIQTRQQFAASAAAASLDDDDHDAIRPYHAPYSSQAATQATRESDLGEAHKKRIQNNFKVILKLIIQNSVDTQILEYIEKLKNNDMPKVAAAVSACLQHCLDLLDEMTSPSTYSQLFENDEKIKQNKEAAFEKSSYLFNALMEIVKAGNSQSNSVPSLQELNAIADSATLKDLAKCRYKFAQKAKFWTSKTRSESLFNAVLSEIRALNSPRTTQSPTATTITA